MFQGKTLHLVIVHTTCFLVQVIAYGLIEDTAGVHQRTMREVATVIQVHTHEGITGLQYGKQYGGVSLSTGVRLHVSILCTEQFADTVDGKLLHLIYYLTAAIVTVSGITLGVFVGQITAHSLHDLIADEVLRRNQFNTFQLTLMLFLNELKNRIVSFHCLFSFIC